MRLCTGHTSQTDEPFEHHFFFYWSSRRLNPVPCGRTPKHNAGHYKHLRVYAGGAATHTRERRPQNTRRHYGECSHFDTTFFASFVTRKAQATRMPRASIGLALGDLTTTLLGINSSRRCYLP